MIINTFQFLVICLTFGTSFSNATNYTDYFKTDFNEAKSDFLKRGQNFTQKNPQNKLVSISLDDGSDSQIDYLYLATPQSKNLIIIQSGIHGVEAHAGSAVQNSLLDALSERNFKKTSFLFIHGINSYGFKNNLRVNKNNVDLNRNFLEGLHAHQIQNEGYRTLNTFLNPRSVYTEGFLSKFTFLFDAVFHIFKYSKDTLKRSLLRGQFDHPQGIYFGGQNLQPESIAVIKIWSEYAEAFQNILIIDLHTGYGEKNKLHLLANSSTAARSKELQDLFTPTAIDFGDTKEFYQTSGDALSLFQTKFAQNKNVNGIAFEFGTLDSQTLMGSMESLYRVISENQGRQHGYKNDQSKSYIQQVFRDMFYPTDPFWREQVLVQGKAEFSKVLDHFENGP